MKERYYTTPLSVTNQFFFCGLPLRLDTYRGCGFQCGFCFARRRGGNTPGGDVVPALPAQIESALKRALCEPHEPVGLVAQFLHRRVPIHFGGMSDPFQAAERKYHVSEAALQTLSRYDYPTVISTRSTLVGSSPYIDILKEMPYVVVQFSLSSSDDVIARRTEPRSFAPSSVLRCMEKLAKHGIKVTCRWQPYIRGVSDEPRDFVRRVADAGCLHLGFEHLKMPLERHTQAWQSFEEAVGSSVLRIYYRDGAKIDGREYVLPAELKRDTILTVASEVHKHGITFGAADNEFQYLSDTSCCCSGADRFAGFENFFKHQIAYAVRSCRNQVITYAAIKDEWSPDGSVDRFLNSKSRISRRVQGGSSIRDHVRKRWNDAGAAGSPSAFFGVTLKDVSADGTNIYRWTS